MNYFIDTEFIESFHKPLFGKRRHFIDMISIAVVDEEGSGFYYISSQYNYNDADKWVKENVIVPAYLSSVSGDMRNRLNVNNFQKHIGLPVATIASDLVDWISKDNDIHFYGYFADYDWVLLCSMFGRMIDLPKGFPMYCRDLKQMMDELGLDKKHPDCPKQNKEHHALHDAVWNKEVYNWLTKIKKQNT